MRIFIGDVLRLPSILFTPAQIIDLDSPSSPSLFSNPFSSAGALVDEDFEPDPDAPIPPSPLLLILQSETLTRVVLVLISTALTIVLADLAPSLYRASGLKRAWRHLRRDVSNGLNMRIPIPRIPSGASSTTATQSRVRFHDDLDSSSPLAPSASRSALLGGGGSSVTPPSLMSSTTSDLSTPWTQSTRHTTRTGTAYTAWSSASGPPIPIPVPLSLRKRAVPGGFPGDAISDTSSMFSPGMTTSSVMTVDLPPLPPSTNASSREDAGSNSTNRGPRDDDELTEIPDDDDDESLYVPRSVATDPMSEKKKKAAMQRKRSVLLPADLDTQPHAGLLPNPPFADIPAIDDGWENVDRPAPAPGSNPTPGKKARSVPAASTTTRISSRPAPTAPSTFSDLYNTSLAPQAQPFAPPLPLSMQSRPRMGGDNLDPLATDGEGSDPLLTDQEPAYEDDGYSDSDSAFALSPSSPYYPLPRAATPPPPPPLPDVLANRARLAGLRAEADGLENDRAQAVASNKRALAISKRSEYKDAVRRLRVVEREVGQEVWRAWRGDEDVLRGEVNVSDLGEDEAVERVEEALVRVLEVPRDVAEEGEAVERAESGGVSGGNYSTRPGNARKKTSATSGPVTDFLTAEKVLHVRVREFMQRMQLAAVQDRMQSYGFTFTDDPNDPCVLHIHLPKE
ncbi:hypothetical protein BDV98DRAFT_574856 [Pterulicium gracile]|uniref:Uncharacterized protein n=1 Tax=Pterulicium gracile TaxID=1884261 RepID=A0A5C3QAP3_9AGAR|nr:hypothetical protein BDV98DRAFT_574856 [Pterula gracilis]